MGLFGPSKKALLEEKYKLESEVSRLTSLLQPEHIEIGSLNDRISKLNDNIVSLDGIIINKQQAINKLNDTIVSLENDISEKRKQLNIFDMDINACEYGIYKPSFVFANSSMYKDKLKDIRDQQKLCIKNDCAAFGSNDWTVNGNQAKGRALVNDTKKLLLRAFNVECDDIVANVKISNLDKSIERIYKISEQISKLGKTMSISITPSYIRLKIDEVKLALDYQQEKQEEKEKKREEREREREEAKVLKEIEEERKRLLKEQTHYQNALNSIILQIEKNGESEDLINKKNQLESQINDTMSAIQNVDYREANRKAGYVYIISNIGAFGENVYKIGMTRRLDPYERVDELGDASVPFKCDVHALIFTDDAPKLEAALHNAFESRKLNKINSRREFFAVTLDEIKAEVSKNHDKTVEWTDIPEAEQYRQSILIK